MGQWARLSAGACVAAALAGCGGNGDDGGANGVCARALSGGSLTTSNTCTGGMEPTQPGGCRITGQAAAVDGSKSTFATLTYNAPDSSMTSGTNVAGGTLGIRATGPSVTYPAGSLVGAYMKFPTDAATQSESLTFVTYLGATQQESFTVFSTTNAAPDLAGNFYYYNVGQAGTAKPFDSVELKVNYQGASAQEDVLVYEMCASY